MPITPLPKLKDFADIVDASNILSTVRNSAKRIELELKRLIAKMDLKPEPREPFKRFLARSLFSILEREKEVCPLVLADSEVERKKESVDDVPERGICFLSIQSFIY